jgi:hypothetical protein
MGFLDDLLKDVEKGIDRVQQGADKLLAENTLRSELDKLKKDHHDLLAEIGEEAIALYAAGEIALPGMSMQIAQLGDIREKIEAKQDEVAALRQARPAGAAAPATDTAPQTAAPQTTAPQTTAPQTAASGHCLACGAQLTEGAAFCPECGHKVE